ncbi:Protein DEHYDRATION-INDUCED 19 homolog 7 [Linum grandiflorum]
MFLDCVLDLKQYVQRKRRLRKGGTNSTLTILRKELHDSSLQTLLGGSSYLISSSEPDPLLSSFMFRPSVVDEPLSVVPAETSPAKGCTIEESTIREASTLASVGWDKEKEEKYRRCEFVRGVMLSTILDEL